MLATCAAASVANVYFAQPLLDALAHDFALSEAWAGGIIGATQAGCALALVLVVPLGDRWVTAGRASRCCLLNLCC